jgi:hypothetical protein
MEVARLRNGGSPELLAKLEAALGALDPELLRPEGGEPQ